MSVELSSSLVTTTWLAEHLEESNLRIFDCNVILGYDEATGLPARAAKQEYEETHIPGAAFLDLFNDLSDHSSGVFFMMPSDKVFSQALSEAGLGNGHQVVLYSSGSVMWATRMWWMLRANGFTNAAVLDGGLLKWVAEGRPTKSGQETYPTATFNATPDPDRWVNKGDVLSNIDSAQVCIINTLSHEAYTGTGEQTPFEKLAYGRPGRIKGSLNVPYASLITHEGVFVPVDQIKQAFENIDGLSQERIIGYCGAGISSTMGAMALHLIGYDNVAIYDGSLNEWGHDHSLPMETGE